MASTRTPSTFVVIIEIDMPKTQKASNRKKKENILSYKNIIIVDESSKKEDEEQETVSSMSLYGCH